MTGNPYVDEICYKCKQYKPLDEFPKSIWDSYDLGKQPVCKECLREYKRQWYLANKAKKENKI